MGFKQRATIVITFLLIMAVASHFAASGIVDSRNYQDEEIKRELVVDGRVTDLKIDADGEEIVEVDGKDVRLDDHIWDNNDQEDLYHKLEMNDTLQIYDPEKVKVNGKQFDTERTRKPMKAEERRRGAYIFTMGMFAILNAVATAIFCFKLDSYLDNRAWRKKRKKTREEEEVSKLKRRVRELEAMKDQSECSQCGNKCRPESTFCDSCGMTIKK